MNYYIDKNGRFNYVGEWNDNIIWNHYDLDELIEAFRKNFERWNNAHSDMAKDNEEIYIRHFLNHYYEIKKISEEKNVPWEWCINDTIDGGRFFEPNYVVLGSGHIYSVYCNNLREVGQPDKTVQNRRVVENTFYKKKGARRYKQRVSRFVCAYFRKYPDDGGFYHGGHKKGHDPEKSFVENDNMCNVYWQSYEDNYYTQQRFLGGEGIGIIANEGHSDMQTPDLCGLDFPKENVAGIEFYRNKDKQIIGHSVIIEPAHIHTEEQLNEFLAENPEAKKMKHLVDSFK